MTDLIPRAAVLALFDAPNILDDIRAIPAAQVAVKPLDFRPHQDISGLYEAKSHIGWFYNIWDLGDGRFSYDGDPTKITVNSPGVVCQSFEAAKSAAQADHDARIRRALTVAPIDPAQIRADALRDGNWGDLIQEAMTEAEKAMRKYPQPNYVITKIAEEAGEVVKAAVHAAEGRETLENLRGEMIQLIAMLFRLWVEGDQVHGLLPVALRVDASQSPETAANAATSQKTGV